MGHDGRELGRFPPGGAVGLGRSNLDGGAGVVYGVAYGLVEEPRIAEKLGVDGSSITREPTTPWD